MPNYAEFFGVVQNETERAVLLHGDSIALLFSVLGEYAENMFNWQGSAEFSDLTEEETDIVKALIAKVERQLMQEVSVGMEIPLGGIIPFAGYTSPDGFVLCDGSLIAQTQYPELYQAVDPVFKVTINSTLYIRVPNLNGRVIVGEDEGVYDIGGEGGETEHTLTIAEMPVHTHGINRSLVAAAGTARRAVEGVSSDVTTLSEGGDEPHNNMQPYRDLRFIMRVT